MSAFRSAVGLLVLVLLGSSAQAQAKGWELVFSEEFEQPTLDKQKWSTRYIFDNELSDTFPSNGERQRYRDNDNHRLHDGQLDLIARKVRHPDSEYPYESGMIRSLQTFYYGYFEARVKTPNGKGTWPAFWLLPDFDLTGNPAWPPEIDVFDNANNAKDATSSMVYSGGVGEAAHQGFEFVYTDPGITKEEVRHYEAGKDLSGEWHVYGLLWTPTHITVWLDGKKLYSAKYKWVTNEDKLAAPAHLLFNLAVGGKWAGRFGIDDKAFPQTFSIDYVRVCQLTQAPGRGGRTCGGSKVTPDPAKHGYRSNAPGGQDAKRPILRDAKLSFSELRRGELGQVTYSLSSPVSTPEPHKLYQYVVDGTGETVSVTALEPKVPSTRWAGKTVTVTAPLELPPYARPGTYRIYVALGSPHKWDLEGRRSLRALTLQYAPDAKHRERIGQPLRYKVGEFRVVP